MTQDNEPGALVAQTESRQIGQLARGGDAFDLTPRSLEEAFRLAEVLASSELVPKDFRDKPANVLVAVQWGHEIGLKPMQALQNIAVINGRPSLWGDAMMALVRSDPRCEYVVESFDAAGTAVCQVKRRGEQEQARTFSIADAATAGLAEKGGPWKTNPKRMRQMRARAFALRDVFADVLKGIPMAEEVADLPPETGQIATPLDQLAQTEGTVPKELLEAGRAAAANGLAEYAVWWKSLEPLQRKVAQHEHEAWKISAAAADKARAAGKVDAELTKGEADAARSTVVDQTRDGIPGETGATFGDDTSGGQA